MITRDDCRARDAADPLAPMRRELDLPPELIYLDGNSLGPLPRRVRGHLETVIRDQWGRDLIRSWNVHGWMDLPLRLGRRIAPLIGAEPDEVAVTDSTSVDLFKLLAAGLDLRPDRGVVLSEADNFPTDLYMVQGLSRMLDRLADRTAGESGPGRCTLRTVERREDLGAALDPTSARDVALVMLTQVDYRTGAMHDLAEVTRRAHDAGALMLWDLSHSTGALEVDLNGAGADLAVGCTYKYLNGGPGSPAFLYVARRHHEALHTPLQGWLGHAAPFDFDPDYRPAPGIARFLCGTPPILSLAALDAALELFDGVDLAAVRAKSMALGDLFLALVDQECGHLDELEIVSPRDGARRGSQVSLRHPEGYAVVQALIARNVIGDFRAPDVLRFGLPPLYLRFVDVWDAVRHLREVLETGEWNREEYRRRAAVT